MENIFKTKCPYVDCCTLYDNESCTCNETGGDYYGIGRMAGCGREISMKGKKAYCYKQPDKKTLDKREKDNDRLILIYVTILLLAIFGVGIFLTSII